jgi:hypothetical protein
MSAPRHDCWDLFVPKDRPLAQAPAGKPAQLKDWFGALVKSQPQPAPAATREAKTH